MPSLILIQDFKGDYSKYIVHPHKPIFHLTPQASEGLPLLAECQQKKKKKKEITHRARPEASMQHVDAARRGALRVELLRNQGWGCHGTGGGIKGPGVGRHEDAGVGGHKNAGGRQTR
jgi:hypothetical protein